MKRGHPTKHQSVCLEKKFQNYYSHGISSETASQELGVDRKTGYAYYKKFSDNIKTINETTFFEVLKSKMKQLTISYDNLLLDLYSDLDSINYQLEQKDANRQSLQNQKLSIIREIRNTLNEKADKVWLLLHENKSEDKAGPFISKITKQLEKERIEVINQYHDRRDLFKIIRAVKSIIEKEKQNDLYVNLASGSKIQAIGTMMACMMFNDLQNIHPFYVEAKNYPGFEGKEPISSGIKDIQDVPPYSIKTPDQKLIQALDIIKKHKGKLTKKEMAELAEKNNLITVNAQEENQSQARFASLDKNIIQPLEEQWKFIEIEKIGRNRWIKLTQDGANAAEFLI